MPGTRGEELPLRVVDALAGDAPLEVPGRAEEYNLPHSCRLASRGEAGTSAARRLLLSAACLDVLEDDEGDITFKAGTLLAMVPLASAFRHSFHVITPSLFGSRRENSRANS